MTGKEAWVALKIARQTLDGIHAHARATYPEECCGLLIAGKDKAVIEAMRMKNAFAGPKHDRYHINPLDLFKADRSVALKGLTITGIYHSHPDYPATLSKFDLDHSFPWYSYVIVSVAKEGAKDTRAWVPNEERTASTEEPIEVLEGRKA